MRGCEQCSLSDSTLVDSVDTIEHSRQSCLAAMHVSSDSATSHSPPPPTRPADASAPADWPACAKGPCSSSYTLFVHLHRAACLVSLLCGVRDDSRSWCVFTVLVSRWTPCRWSWVVSQWLLGCDGRLQLPNGHSVIIIPRPQVFRLME